VPEAEHLAALAERAGGGDERAGAALVDAMAPLIASLSRRLGGRVPADDLQQAGAIGVLEAARRYDRAAGASFPAYATPFVTGEMIRCLRQELRPVRVPRAAETTYRTVELAITELGRAGRRATVQAIVEHSGLEEEDVVEALQARHAQEPAPIDSAAGDLTVDDEELTAVEARLDFAGRLDELDERSRRIVALRYGAGLSQREIAERMGISQMHVSRLLRRALEQLSANVC